jgi:hypothetical protein
MKKRIEIVDYLNDIIVGKNYIVVNSIAEHHVKVLGKGYRCAFVRNVDNEDEFCVDLKKVKWYKK